MKLPLLKKGIIAYYDTVFSGLVKVRVLSVESSNNVKVRVLTGHKEYPKDTILEKLLSSYVVPCAAIKRKNEKIKIGQYNIRFDSDNID